MRSIIGLALVILMTCNGIYFYTKRQKLAIKYNEPFDKEDDVNRRYGEEFRKESYKLIIGFAVVNIVLQIILMILFFEF